MRLGIVGPDRERVLIMPDCLVDAIQGLQGKAETEMGLGVVRTIGERLPMVRNRPRRLLQRLQSDAEAVLGLGIARPLVARSADQTDCLVELPRSSRMRPRL